jgi:putative transposase
LLEWIASSGIATALIGPGKPGLNANHECLNGKSCNECLSLEWLRAHVEPKVVIELWRRHYDAARPHGTLDYSTPLEFKQRHPSTPNRAVLRE